MAESSTCDVWLVVTVEAPSQASRDDLAEGLLALGGSAIHETGSQVTTYVRRPDDLRGWLANATTTLRDMSGIESLELQTRLQPAEDWSQLWKLGLGPRRVGRRFVVAPSWNAPAAAGDDLVIIVDPEMAFGTGEHATTRASLRFLERTVTPGSRVLDVGTGSAILAIAAAMLGARDVVALDNDGDAIINARDNVTRNGVEAVVTLAEGTVDETWLGGHTGSFDVIVANVLSSVLVPLLPALWSATRVDGHVILGGILEQEADDVLAACSAAAFAITAEELEEEWWAVLLRRRAQ